MRKLTFVVLSVCCFLGSLHADSGSKKSYQSREIEGRVFTEKELLNDEMIHYFVSHPQVIRHFQVGWNRVIGQMPKALAEYKALSHRVSG